MILANSWFLSLISISEGNFYMQSPNNENMCVRILTYLYMLILISKDFDMVMIISVGESCLWVPWVIFKLLTDVQWGQSLGFCYHCLHLFPYHPTIKGEKEREETSNVYFRVIMLDAALSRVGKKKRKKILWSYYNDRL